VTSLDERRDRTLRVSCSWDCGICSAVCKPDCIRYADNWIEIDLDRCVLCFHCVRACPSGVIGEKDFV